MDYVNCLASEEYNKIIFEWNQKLNNYSNNKTIHQLFEEQVERTPENIALVFLKKKMTYRELNKEVNQLANFILQNYNIKQEEPIALCLERSEQIVVSILAILKVGGAYVPLDPQYPEERIKYILSDTETKVIITNAVYKDKFKSLGFNNNAIAIDSALLKEQLQILSSQNLGLANKPQSLAYIIYTSGTTGQPKGVLQTHDNVMRLFTSTNDWYNFNSQDVWSLFHSYIFDFSVWEIWGALFYGGKIIVVSYEETRDFEKFYTLCKKEGVTVLNQTPTAFYQLMNIAVEQKNDDKLFNLRYVIFGGEALNLQQLTPWFEMYGYQKPRLINMYGITELTVHVSYKPIEKEDIGKNSYIGRVLPDLTAYVLNASLEPVCVGEVGELHIGGTGLARGYLKRPELTADRFFANPFQSETEKCVHHNDRLYKTGDLVRWLPDGSLEYIGRNDFQVKIRGHRIELGEIESVLSAYSGIKQTVVVAKKQSAIENETHQYLVAYYVSSEPLKEDDIRDYVQSRLPDYMVPYIFMWMPSLPLTLNGKLDKNALPNPALGHQDAYIAPRNELEKTICQIWGEVLGLSNQQVGIRDDFFRLGGDSIMAIKLVNKLNKALDKKISILAILRARTIEKLFSDFNINSDELLINKVEVTGLENQKLSFAQERLWFIEKYEEGTNAYHIPMVYYVLPTTDLSILRKSIQAIVARHEVLRTIIKENDKGDGYQYVLDNTKYPLDFKTISVVSQEQLHQMIDDEINHIFELGQEYPVRVCFYELVANKAYKKENYMSIVVHHIAFDGWSTDIFGNELQLYYDYYTQQSKGIDSELKLPALSIQYKDFALWQREHLSSQRLEEQLDYWLKQLSGYENLNLVTDLTRPKNINYSGHEIYFKIDEETSSALRILAKSLGVSLYSVLLAGYAIMLKAYSNQKDIVIGTPVANRHYPQVEHLIGFLVNSLPLRIKIDDEVLVSEYIQSVGGTVLQAQLHQDLPFEKLVDKLVIEKNTSLHPIFQVMFGMANFGRTKNTIYEEYKSNFRTPAQFDISTSIDDTQDCIAGVFNYATSLYLESTIKGFIHTYQTILRQLTNAQSCYVASLHYVDSFEYEQIVFNWNSTYKEYPRDITVHQLFESQVEKTPNDIAVVHDAVTLTYKELNERSNQLAHYLFQNCILKPEVPIAFCLDKKPLLIIVILAILKVGKAYLSIDPESPDARMQYILNDIDAELVLTSESYVQRFKNIKKSESHYFSVLALDNQEIQKALDKNLSINPQLYCSNKNLAYVVYTSGTTGHPKGVMVDHKNLVVSYFGWKTEYHLDLIKNHLQMASASFDVFSGDLVRALLSGGKLVLCPKDIMISAEKLYQLIINEEIEIAEFVPVVLNNLANYLEENKLKLTQIKLLISGSDYWAKSDYIRVKKLCHTESRVINSYGLTETVIDSLYFEEKSAELLTETLPIGSLLPNTTLYVLDNQLRPLPLGAVGELYIGGERLARGYINRPELTAERFIANLFQSEEEKCLNRNMRLYKTGDLVRWGFDRNLEYVGRDDFQVKIRGHRIELGEIESLLESYEGIKRAVVVSKVDKKDKDRQYLVAYYLSLHPFEEEIRKHLQSLLPDYMVPNVLIHLKELPINLNGKLDRKALPDVDFVVTPTYTPPRNEIESKLCIIWAEVLGLSAESIGINDGFFRLGGNSILVINLISKINQKLGSTLSISAIFENNTVNKLSDYLINIQSDSEKGKSYVF